MIERILQVPGGWLRLDDEAFSKYFVPEASQAEPVEALLTAEQMASLTSVKASWFEAAARDARIPCVWFGKYPRFSPTAVNAHLTKRPDHRACVKGA